MNSILVVVLARTAEYFSKTGYLTGAVIALLILVYLIYSLIKPEKF